jgi:hypothetical protein
MPHSGKKDKFFIYAVERKGRYKGTRLMGTNHLYEGGEGNITVQDLIDFLNKHGINPSRVPLRSFTTRVK